MGLYHVSSGLLHIYMILFTHESLTSLTHTILYRILTYSMISDFFLPVVGGIEGHVYSLSVELMKLGHRVCLLSPPR